MSDARVVITRGAGSRFYWSLSAHGELHDCRRSEASMIKAAEAAEATLTQADLARHYKRPNSA